MTEFSGESSINHVSGVDAQPRFKVGDRVRVKHSADVRLAGDMDEVKSIEIITPAKPSVADLPEGSVVRAGGKVFVKSLGEFRSTYVWRGMDGQFYPHSNLDGMDWTLLVEEKSNG